MEINIDIIKDALIDYFDIKEKWVYLVGKDERLDFRLRDILKSDDWLNYIKKEGLKIFFKDQNKKIKNITLIYKEFSNFRKYFINCFQEATMLDLKDKIIKLDQIENQELIELETIHEPRKQLIYFKNFHGGQYQPVPGYPISIFGYFKDLKHDFTYELLIRPGSLRSYIGQADAHKDNSNTENTDAGEHGAKIEEEDGSQNFSEKENSDEKENVNKTKNNKEDKSISEIGYIDKIENTSTTDDDNKDEKISDIDDVESSKKINRISKDDDDDDLEEGKFRMKLENKTNVWNSTIVNDVNLIDELILGLNKKQFTITNFGEGKLLLTRLININSKKNTPFRNRLKWDIEFENSKMNFYYLSNLFKSRGLSAASSKETESLYFQSNINKKSNSEVKYTSRVSTHGQSKLKFNTENNEFIFTILFQEEESSFAIAKKIMVWNNFETPIQ